MRPAAKGWCPDAYRLMQSGDGWIARIKPPFGSLTATQALVISDLAEEFGNGIIDLTSRANVQLRGIEEQRHAALINHLIRADLLDLDPRIEARRSILVQPDWTPHDLTYRLTETLLARLTDLPDLPVKFGFAMDTGQKPLLRAASADIRIERGSAGLIVRADGAAEGAAASEADAIDTVVSLAHWFADTGGTEHKRRMAAHLERVALPDDFRGTPPARRSPPAAPGVVPGGRIVGVPFGAMRANDLRRLGQKAARLHLLPDRLIFLRGEDLQPVDGFVRDPSDPRQKTHACPGAPACASASVETRSLARQLARPGLHVSGCAKGCAHPRAAELTLVGRDGRYDLVRNGAPWDMPTKRGLSVADIREALG
jgi:precorrin-3B synthase